MNMHNINCIDDNTNIVRSVTRASIKSMIGRGAASQILEVANSTPLSLSIYYNLSSFQS